MIEGFVPPRYRILKLGDPVLRIRSEEVKNFDGNGLLRLVERLNKAATLAEGAGVCAPQVGVATRVFSWRLERHVGHIVNPEIVEADGAARAREGCLSMPNMFFDIERSKSVFISGQDILGESVSYEATGWLAKLFQHELDHLNGTLMIDRLDDEQWATFEEQWYELYGKPCPGDRRPPVGD